MKETEIHEAIRMGHLKSKTRIRPDMFSETFRLKVGRFLSDGGNIKTLSTRLDLTPDTLRLWRRLHQSKSVQDKLKKQQERALQVRIFFKNKHSMRNIYSSLIIEAGPSGG